LFIKSFAVYVGDIFTGVTMLSTDKWQNAIFDACPETERNGCVFIPFNTAKILFCSCILFSFLLLAYEARKTKKIIASRDISYAYTNVMANNYYSLRSYDHFCLFCQINDSTKTVDNFAFFVFFSFKEWKRLLLADGPRQAINALTLYSIYLSKKDDGSWDNFQKYSDNYVTTLLLCSTLFTVIIFAGSLLLLLVAGIAYIPLLCYIRGNLKEFCCHKVDKRISELIKKKVKDRQKEQIELDKKEAMGDFSHLKGGKAGNRLPQPTLPNVSVDDDLGYDNKNDYKSDYQSSMYSGRRGGGASGYDSADYPPMPMYAYDRGYGDNGSTYEYDGHRHGTPQPYQQPVTDPYDGNRHGTPRPVAQYEDDGQYSQRGQYQPQQYQHQQHQYQYPHGGGGGGGGYPGH
jgi:mRNA-degrading endonuclease RelE of RelBE toxin-antitoxin system